MATKKSAKVSRRKSVVGIGEFLVSWRENLGMNQTTFARQLAISNANLCDIEKGRQMVSIRKAADIAKKMGCSIPMLVELAVNEQLAMGGVKVRVRAKDM